MIVLSLSCRVCPQLNLCTVIDLHIKFNVKIFFSHNWSEKLNAAKNSWMKFVTILLSINNGHNENMQRKRVYKTPWFLSCFFLYFLHLLLAVTSVPFFNFLFDHLNAFSKNSELGLDVYLYTYQILLYYCCDHIFVFY